MVRIANSLRRVEVQRERREQENRRRAQARHRFNEVPKGERSASRLLGHFRSNGPAWVYFIQAGQDGPIKIGVSDSVFDRLKALQTGNPEPLRLIAAVIGDTQDELALHRRFRRQRLIGEWFRPSKKLLEYANRWQLGPAAKLQAKGSLVVDSRSRMIVHHGADSAEYVERHNGKPFNLLPMSHIPLEFGA